MTQAQKDALILAREARELKSARQEDIEAILRLQRAFQKHSQQEARTAVYQVKAKNATKKYQMSQRRAKRMEDANIKHKAHLAALKDENEKLRREAGNSEKENQKLHRDINQVLWDLQNRIAKLSEERKELQREKTNLSRKASRFRAMKKALQERARQSASRGHFFKLTHQGVYTKQARRLARYLSSVGTAEAKVGEAISAVGKVIGVEVDRIMDKRTVKRAVLESGVAAEIQLGYEMAKSDSEFGLYEYEYQH